MDIKLTGALPRELKDLGLKPGDRFKDVEPVTGLKYGAMRLRVWHDDEERVAVVYQENYVKL